MFKKKTTTKMYISFMLIMSIMKFKLDVFKWNYRSTNYKTLTMLNMTILFKQNKQNTIHRYDIMSYNNIWDLKIPIDH